MIDHQGLIIRDQTIDSVIGPGPSGISLELFLCDRSGKSQVPTWPRQRGHATLRETATGVKKSL